MCSNSMDLKGLKQEENLKVLNEEGFLKAEKEDVHFVPHGDRSKVVVEPF